MMCVLGWVSKVWVRKDWEGRGVRKLVVIWVRVFSRGTAYQIGRDSRPKR